MTSSPTRQDAEHRLASLVASWVKTCDEKAGVMAEYNKDIKALEEAIEKLSAEIQGNAFQPTLPFDEARAPSITLSETDPDAQSPKDCGLCGHLAVYHEAGGCIQPDCECKAFVTFTVVPPVEETAAKTEDPTACLLCGHPEGVHGTTRKRGCMRAECDCKRYEHPDPLGVADVEPEKREAEL